ncbi:MAG: dTDP-4-dehydrorhamnose 3,5-epimerase [Flavobacteriaceae bacterium]|nr:dTDP-4-dehydrorhamnose 3,5-epimerase [Flavobacteriaceae bacterium]
MKVIETPLQDCYIIEPEIFYDHRGEFLEAYNKRNLESALGFGIDFVQDNHSVSRQYVLRGLHYQNVGPQAKLIRVIKGRIQDVVVDAREESPTFGKHFSMILDDVKHQQLLIPKGYLHGFLALEEQTIITYKCDDFYNAKADVGIIYNDDFLDIDWVVDSSKIILSEKDKNLPTFQEVFCK